jgi:hypothetical protein
METYIAEYARRFPPNQGETHSEFADRFLDWLIEQRLVILADEFHRLEREKGKA